MDTRKADGGVSAETPVVELEGWTLELICSKRCGITFLPVRLLPAMHPGTPLSHYLPRLKCKRCGSGPESVALVDNPAAARPSRNYPDSRRIVLVVPQ